MSEAKVEQLRTALSMAAAYVPLQIKLRADIDAVLNDTRATLPPQTDVALAEELEAKKIVFKAFLPMHPYYTECEMQHLLERGIDPDRALQPDAVYELVLAALRRTQQL